MNAVGSIHQRGARVDPDYPARNAPRSTALSESAFDFGPAVFLTRCSYGEASDFSTAGHVGIYVDGSKK